MKKILFLAVFVSCLTAFAQKRSKNDMETMMYAGYNAFWYSEGSRKASDALQSIGGGITADYYFNQSWSFRTGFGYQTMGGTNLMIGSDLTEGGTEKLGFLDIPLQANWHFGGKGNWNINFGITPGLMLNAKGIYPNSQDIGILLQEFRYRFQLGLTGGIGYQYPISEHFSVLVDYQLHKGLTDMTKNDGKSITTFGYGLNAGGVFKL